MKSVGEVMAIGRNFQESFQKALRGLEIGIDGLTNSDLLNKDNKDYLKNQLGTPAPDRILYLAEAIRQGFNLNEIYELTHIDLWFLSQIDDLVKEELSLKNKKIDELSISTLMKLKKKGFSEEVVTLAGLAKKNKEGKLYDVFRDRLMFPIKDRKGRVVGFGGRVMNPNDQPKYLNTGDTPIFQKGKELYGLFEALEVRKDLNKLFVVEGYMDTVAMSEHGLRNSVATLGIATNRFHVQKLLQLVNEIIFCFDGDDAGRGAAWGAL